VKYIDPDKVRWFTVAGTLLMALFMVVFFYVRKVMKAFWLAIFGFPIVIGLLYYLVLTMKKYPR